MSKLIYFSSNKLYTIVNIKKEKTVLQLEIILAHSVKSFRLKWNLVWQKSV
jgi:hypothetical protein